MNLKSKTSHDMLICQGVLAHCVHEYTCLFDSMPHSVTIRPVETLKFSFCYKYEDQKPQK